MIVYNILVKLFQNTNTKLKPGGRMLHLYHHKRLNTIIFFESCVLLQSLSNHFGVIHKSLLNIYPLISLLAKNKSSCAVREVTLTDLSFLRAPND